jgi:hypothetical protein
MALRPSIAVVLVGAMASLGASFRTPNFDVEAPDPAFAEQIGKYAEHYRKQKAVEWLGQEMPNWGRRCPLRVTVTGGGSGGATEFQFDNGRILTISMHIEGTPDRLLASVLPHEITHTVLAYYFRAPIPRWADEGGSVLSEDDHERALHDRTVKQILRTPGRSIALRRLFTLMQYPNDVMVLYAEGYSVTNFLVSQSSRQVFLAFIAEGMQGNWDAAVRKHYRFRNVEELEGAWVRHLMYQQQPATQLASTRGSSEGSAHVVVRQTAPPSQPILEAPQPVYRGQMPDDAPSPAARPYSAPRSEYSRIPPLPPQPPRSETPEFQRVPPAMPQLGAPEYAPRSPVGFSP